jgi:competence protein ComEC
MRRALDGVSRRPFLPLAAGLAVGIALSDRSQPSALAQGLLLGASAILLLVTILLGRRVAIAGIFLAAAAAGLWRHERAERFPADDVASLEFGGDPAELTGRVVEPLRLYRDARPLDELEERHGDLVRGTFVLESGAIRAGDRALRGRVLVQFYEHEASFPIGSLVRVTGKLRTPRGQTNPGGYDRRKALRRRDIGAVLSVSRGDALEVVGPPAPGWSTAVESVRASIRDRLHRCARPDVAAFLSALILGYREDLPDALVTSLQRSGTAHFIAISGQNLMILVGVLFGALYLAGLRGPRLNIALMALLFAYSALTGWPVSVVRAFLMTFAVLLATALWRRSDTASSLAAAATAILLFDPVQLFDPGFQLSFLAVIGIIAISPVFHDWLALPGAGTKLSWAGNLVRGALAVSMSAWLATAPVVLANFNLVTPIILVANLLLFPLMFVEMALGLIMIPLAFVAPPAATLVGHAAAAALDLTALISGGLTRLPGSWLYLPALAAGPTAAYYALLAIWTAASRRTPAPWKPWACAIFPCLLVLPVLAARPPAAQETTMLDVGPGSAQVVRFPDGRVIIFDCGSNSCRDAGASVMAPFLWTCGLVKIDALFLSHSDLDHVNGARSLVERFKVGAVVVSRYFDREPAGAALLDWLRARGTRIVLAGRDGADPVDLGPGLTILGPPSWEKYGRIPRSNECSLVLRAGDVLFTGDIEEVGVEELLTLGDAVRTRVFVAPHHGKLHLRHADLLHLVSPEIALVSAPERYSSPVVVDLLRAHAAVFTTGRDGAVTIRSPRADPPK